MAAIKTARTIALTPTQRLKNVEREWHTRKLMGREKVYVAQDRLGEWTILSQHLALLAKAINELTDERGGRVSTTTLWKGVDRDSDRCGCWIKGRWCVRTVDLDSASEEFEKARKGFTNAVVVATEPACYLVSV